MGLGKEVYRRKRSWGIASNYGLVKERTLYWNENMIFVNSWQGSIKEAAVKLQAG